MSSIKYLRFTIINNNGNLGVTTLNEFYLLDNLNNTVPLYTLIDSTFTITDNSIDPFYPITNLFDGKNFTITQWNTANHIVTTIKFNTPWTTTQYPGYALYLDNGSTRYSYSKSNNPNNFKVELSTNNINWITYSTIENQNIVYNIPHGLGGGSLLYRFTFDSICVAPNTNILMSDYTYKPICELHRGDKIVQDRLSGKIGKIARIIISSSNNRILIKKGLIGNTEELIITGGHPIWINNDNNRIYAKDIKGVFKLEGIEQVYSIQMEEEGTFYAEGIKVDSLSPNFYKFKLPKEEFFNKRKHDKRCIITIEDDPKRLKPKMI